MALVLYCLLIVMTLMVTMVSSAFGQLHTSSLVWRTLVKDFIYLQDGSYSRGPVDIPVGEYDESNYYLSPTFKFEQVSFTCYLG